MKQKSAQAEVREGGARNSESSVSKMESMVGISIGPARQLAAGDHFIGGEGIRGKGPKQDAQQDG